MSVQLYQGDCLELMRAVPDGSVDMVLCDLPYGVTRNSWDKPLPLERLWGGYWRVCKPNAAVVLLSQMPFTVDLINSQRQFFRYEWIYQKTNVAGFLNAKKMPLKVHENICVFYQKFPTYNPQYWYAKPYTQARKSASKNYGKQAIVTKTVSEDGKRYPLDVVRFCNTPAQGGHPTQKPVDLCEYLIRTYTNEGETVLDNCMGSGSTGVACVNTGRNFIGMELDADYFAMARRRIDEASAQCCLFHA